MIALKWIGGSDGDVKRDASHSGRSPIFGKVRASTENEGIHPRTPNSGFLVFEELVSNETKDETGFPDTRIS